MSFGPRPATAPVGLPKQRIRQAAPSFIKPAFQESFSGSLGDVVDLCDKPKHVGVARGVKARLVAESSPVPNRRHIHPAPKPTIAEEPVVVRKKLVSGVTSNEESPMPKKTTGKRPFPQYRAETEQPPTRMGKHVRPGVSRNPIVGPTPRVSNARKEHFRSNLLAWATSPRAVPQPVPAARKPMAAAPYDVSSGGTNTVFSNDVGTKPKFRKCFASVATRPKTARGLLTWA